MSTTALAPAAPPVLPAPPSRRWRPCTSCAPAERAGDPALVSDGLVCPLESGAEVEYANLDHGASTSAFVAVKAAVGEASLTYSSVHRGNGYASRVTSARYEQAREVVARFVGARADDHVIFTRNTTDSFNLLASVVPQDAQVFVFGSDHHATILPWRAEQLVRLPVPASPAEAVSVVDAALRTSRAAEALVVVTGASNVTGEYWPVAQIAAVARRHGARSRSTPPSSSSTAPSTSRSRSSTTSPSRGTRSTRPTAPACSSGARTGSTRPSPTSPGRCDRRGLRRGHDVADRARTARGGQPERPRSGGPGRRVRGRRRAPRGHRRARRDARAGPGQPARRDPRVQTHSIFGPTHDRAPVVTFTVEGRSAQEVSRRLSDEHGIGCATDASAPTSSPMPSSRGRGRAARARSARAWVWRTPRARRPARRRGPLPRPAG